MLINKTIEVDKGEVKISRQGNIFNIEYVNCKQKASTTNKILDAILPVINTMFGYESTEIELGTFEEAKNNIRYALNIAQTLMSLKLESCKSNSPLVEDLQYRLKIITSCLHTKITDGSYSYAEKLVLGKIGDVGFSMIDTHDLAEFYNPKTLSLSRRLAKLEHEVNDYDYKKQGHDKTKITELFNSLVKQLKESIVTFENLVKEHGDDLINWGSHKLTRRGVNDYTVRRWVDSYQDALKEKGVKPLDKKVNSVEKSRNNENKTQKDYLRLFKNGTLDEAKHVISNLSLESLLSLLTISDKRVRNNKDEIIQALCYLDNGENFYPIFIFKGESTGYYSSPLPMSYLFKVANNFPIVREATQGKEINVSDFISCFKSTREMMPVPDSFYDKVLKEIPMKEALNMNPLVTDAVFSRLEKAQIVNVIKRLAGVSTIFESVGLDVVREKMGAQISPETIRKLDATIYPEIKDYILELNDCEDFDEMVVANKDKTLAKRMFATNKGRKQILATILSYTEKVKLVKEKVDEGGTFNCAHDVKLTEIFSEQEQKEVFKELLTFGNSKANNYLTKHLEYIKWYDKKNYPKYLEILESIPCKYAPIESLMPKKTRVVLAKNGVTCNKAEVSDFTREELDACGFDVDAIARIFPKRLTVKELLEKATNLDFLKENLELYPKEYLKERFPDELVIKKFIGSKVHTANKIAYNKLTRKLSETEGA